VKIAFRKSFERDLRKLRTDTQSLNRIRKAILDVESVGDILQRPNVRKLSGGSGEYYRIRVGDYRIGVQIENDVVVFVRCLHRKDIYRFFPQ